MKTIATETFISWCELPARMGATWWNGQHDGSTRRTGTLQKSYGQTCEEVSQEAKQHLSGGVECQSTMEETKGGDGSSLAEQKLCTILLLLG